MREKDEAAWKEREQIQAMLSRHISTEKGRKASPPKEERPAQRLLRDQEEPSQGSP